MENKISELFTNFNNEWKWFKNIFLQKNEKNSNFM